jgi:hypothetical protein
MAVPPNFPIRVEPVDAKQRWMEVGLLPHL